MVAMTTEYHEYTKTPELYTLKMIKMGNFMLYEFYLKKKPQHVYNK